MNIKVRHRSLIQLFTKRFKQTLKQGNGIDKFIGFSEQDDGRIMKDRTQKRELPLILQQFAVKNLFPADYPHSVKDGYAGFARMQMLSALLSSICGILSTQSLLVAVGLGAGSIPLAATLNWVIKDGAGQLGGILFASIVNSKFDRNPKKWRMISAIALEVSTFIELLTPLVPSYFLLLASVSNAGKNISYLASGASRAAIHKSFAKNENLADITAKTGSQNIVSSMIGTGLGITVASLIGNTYEYAMLVFGCCSSLSLVATYFSLKNVTINTLDAERFEQLLHDYFKTYYSNAINTNNWQLNSTIGDNNIIKSLGTNARILSPSHIQDFNKSILFQSFKQFLPFQNNNKFHHNNSNNSDDNSYYYCNNIIKIKIGEDLDVVLNNMKQFETLKSIFHKDKYILNIHINNSSSNTSTIDSTINDMYMNTPIIDLLCNNYSSPSLSSLQSIHIHLLFYHDATIHDVLTGYINAYHAKMILYHHIMRINNNSSSANVQNNNNSRSVNIVTPHKILIESRNVTNLETNNGTTVTRELIERLLHDKQWIVSNNLIETKNSRILTER